MNIGELKELIKDLPDETKVVTGDDYFSSYDETSPTIKKVTRYDSSLGQYVEEVCLLTY